MSTVESSDTLGESMASITIETSDWSNQLCSCCHMKDCGGMCLFNECFCPCCVWGSAMGAAGMGNCSVCCIAMSFCPCFALCKSGQDVAGRYGVDEGCCTASIKCLVCFPCYKLQVQNEIMVRENLRYGCVYLEKDPVAASAPTMAETPMEAKSPGAGGAPASAEMHR